MDIRIEKTHLDEVVSAINNALSTILKLKKEQKEREALKQSSIPLDYEIISADFYAPVHELILHPENMNKIYSVKRKSDNSIWNIKDDTNHGIIKEFVISDFGMYAQCERGKFNINELKKVKQPIPLFITEDNVEIIYLDWLLYVVNTAWVVFAKDAAWCLDKINNPEENKYFKYFKEKEAAKEYILMNKPCLSVGEIINVNEDFILRYEFQNRLKELAKQKINGIQ